MLSVLLTTKEKKSNAKIDNFNTKNHEDYAKSTIGFKVIDKYKLQNESIDLLLTISES